MTEPPLIAMAYRELAEQADAFLADMHTGAIDGEWVITAWSADNRELCLADRG